MPVLSVFDLHWLAQEAGKIVRVCLLQNNQYKYFQMRVKIMQMYNVIVITTTCGRSNENSAIDVYMIVTYHYLIDCKLTRHSDLGCNFRSVDHFSLSYENWTPWESLINHIRLGTYLQSLSMYYWSSYVAGNCLSCNALCNTAFRLCYQSVSHVKFSASWLSGIFCLLFFLHTFKGTGHSLTSTIEHNWNTHFSITRREFFIY